MKALSAGWSAWSVVILKFDVEAFKKKARDDFEGAWHDGPSVLTPPGVPGRYPRLAYRSAAAHPVFETVQHLRNVYLQMGFDEMINPVFVEEQDVRRQFGPEAMAVLDRVFYLGGLPRPNVGIARKHLESISVLLGHAIAPAVEDMLRETLHAYKKSLIDGDDLVHELASVLEADDALVAEILDTVFPEFRDLTPEPTRTTLRSHMTSGWFITLGELWEHLPLPARMFSIDRCFRREQEESPTRLMTYHSASCVVAGEDITNEEGKAVSEALLSGFGFTDFQFRPDEKRSKYYMPDTQTEVFARHPVHGWVEVATFGMYSPSALAGYGIGVPVMNLGLGVERLAMIEYLADDVRRLVHPQFFPQVLSDRQIAAAIHLREEPATIPGRRLAEAVVRTAAEYAPEPGPCSFPAWEGNIRGRDVRVFVEEQESGTKLCGPAAFNEVFVCRGSILAVPDTEKFAGIRKDGIATGITCLDAVASLAAARIEESARCGDGTAVQVKMARLPGDVNLKIEDYVMRYITDNNLKIDVRGPVFLAVRSEVGAPSE